MPSDRAQIKILTDFDERICVVIGTRPAVVMMSPVIRELAKRDLPFTVVHSGQHYSYNMDRQFIEELQLPEPDHKLEHPAEGSLHGAQTARMLEGCEEVFIKERPRLVLVGGDANTNLAAALAARKLHIQVGHIEAGERSFDWRMPEEHNRVMIDHIAEYLFTTNDKGREHLENDNVRGRIFVTGNPIVDATHQNLAIAAGNSSVLNDLGVEREGYFALTVHREENVDSEAALRGIFEGILLLRQAFDQRIIFAAHPRTQRRIAEFGLDDFVSGIDGLVVVPALGYLEFLSLVTNAALVLTDSGGVQQEACILRVPCVTLRENTEWTETLALNANVLAGASPDAIVQGAAQMLNAPRVWENPFGDGTAAARIVDVASEALDPARPWDSAEIRYVAESNSLSQ
jgi:UDP-N-acetylglucosamine 2-epimerase (non-hydrolysing)